MQNRNWAGSMLAMLAGVIGVFLMAGCAPLMAGKMAEAGYNAAKSSLGGADGQSVLGTDPRQKKLQSVLNSVDIGQNVDPILELMGEQPKEKTGNTYGFTCYEYPAVYSAADAAVLVAKDGKVVFYGNSHCSDEMQDANFQQGGKYEVNSQP